MQTFETFTDERSGYAAVAAETLACCGVLVGDSFAAGDVVELPDASTLADPALLAVGGSNPNGSLFAVVVYAQRPLGLEIIDVFVGDGDLTDRIYDHQVIISKHELGSNPHKQGADSNGSAETELKPVHRVFNRVQNHLSHEKAIKQDGYCGPCEVALGSEDKVFIHASIIAGIAAVQEGK